MDTRIEAFLTAADRFDAVVDHVETTGAWEEPSPCPGWRAADVVTHVVETQREFLAGRDLDLGPDGADGADGAEGADGPAARWRRHLAAVRDVVADEATVTAAYEGYFGPTSIAETLDDFYGFDLRVHRWDLGRAAGLHVEWDEADLARIEGLLDAAGESLYGDGICAPPLAVPADASRQQRLLARTGRTAA